MTQQQPDINTVPSTDGLQDDLIDVQAAIVQKVDSTIHHIGISKTNWAFHWIVIYPVDIALSTFWTTGARFLKHHCQQQFFVNLDNWTRQTT